MLHLFIDRMGRRFRLIAAVLSLLLLPAAFAGAQGTLEFEAAFPYDIANADKQVIAGSTNPCYLVLTNTQDREETVSIRLSLPPGLEAVRLTGWEQAAPGEWTQTVHLNAYYGQWFDLLYIRADEAMPPGEHLLNLRVERHSGVVSHPFPFTVLAPAAGLSAENKADSSGWRIEAIRLPVDHDGRYDERAENGVLQVSDRAWEGLKDTLAGRGATNWATLEHHPVGYVAITVGNPQRDTQMLRVRAELTDRDSGHPVPGLRPAGQAAGEYDNASWIGDASDNASTALVTLTGQSPEQFIIPLYGDDSLQQGEYRLKLSVEGSDQRQELNVPVGIVMRRGGSIAVLVFAGLCVAAFAWMFISRVQSWLSEQGPKGIITIALFASFAFGSISVPTTLLGDSLQLLLGPFAGLVSGLLSGVLYYLLVTALLTLYPGRGTLPLMVFLHWLLGAIIFGRLTLVGLALCCTKIVLLDCCLVAGRRLGFTTETRFGRLMMAACLGLADAVFTYITMELMMFFYRLYYADWYIWLYVVVSGFTYSLIGALMGYAMGDRLKQVTGE